jgi:hypothetical protein
MALVGLQKIALLEILERDVKMLFLIFDHF